MQHYVEDRIYRLAHMQIPRVRRRAPVIRTILMLAFWAAALPVAALLGFPWTFLTGNITFLYRMGMWGAWTGVRLAGATRPARRGTDLLSQLDGGTLRGIGFATLDPVYAL